MDKERLFAVGVFAIMFGAVIAIAVYSFLSPTPSLFFLAMSGGLPQENAHTITIGQFYGTSCIAKFESEFGSAEVTYDVCENIEFDTTATPLFRLESVSLGLKEGHIQKQLKRRPVNPCESGTDFVRDGAGWEFYDFPTDDFVWTLPYTIDGVKQSQATVEGGYSCVSGGCRIGYNICGTVFNEIPNLGSCGYDGAGTCKNIISKGTIVEADSTYRLEVGETWTFSIINPNFYDQEDYARNTIGTAPELRELDCPIRPGYMVATQDFAAGSTIALNNLAYPVNYFCSQMPALILDAEGKQIASSTDPYKQMLDGTPVLVPSNQIYEIFWVMRLTDDITIVCAPEKVASNPDGSCPEGSDASNDGFCYVTPIYDADTYECVVMPGIVHFCRDGIWDPATLSCAVYPDQHLICPPGTAYVLPESWMANPEFEKLIASLPDDVEYDLEVETPYCKYIPPVQAVCSRDDSIYDNTLDKCVFKPNLVPVCDAKAEYDSGIGLCAYTPDRIYSCPVVEDTTTSLVDEDGSTYCKHSIISGEFINGSTYALDCSPWDNICSSENYVYSSIYELCVSHVDNETVSGVKPSYCRTTPDVEYSPCDVDYDTALPGKCVKVPEYEDELVCPTGWVKDGDLCLSDALTKVDCNPGYYYQKDAQQCVRILPAEYYCTQEGGRWVQETSECFQDPNTYVDSCPDKFDWVEEKNACIMYRDLTETFTCIKGTFNPLTATCDIPGTARIVEPIVGTHCLDGDWNEELRRCELAPTIIIPTDVEVENEELESIALMSALFAFIALTTAAAVYIKTKYL